MAFLKFNSIRNKLTYWFLLLAFIPLIATLVITYFQRVQVIEQRTFDKLTAIRDLKVERLNEWLNEREGDILAISTDMELTEIEGILNNSLRKPEQKRVLDNCRRILNRYLNNYNSYHEFHILNPANGKIMISTKEYLEGEDRSNEDYFKVPLKTKSLSIIDIHHSNLLNDFIMSYTTPIKSTSGKIIGILIANIDLKKTLYEQLLERVGLGETGETLIVNSDVYALNQLRWYDKDPLTLQISAEPAVMAAKGNTGITETQDYRGEDILAAYTYIPKTQWGFVCKQDLHELNEPIREMIFNFILIFIISSIMIVLVAFRIGKSISTPIVEMDNVAKVMKSGDLSVRNYIKSEDELGSLATEFNNMADITESRIKIQKGIATISETMIGKAKMHEFAKAVLAELVEMTEANIATFYLLNENTEEFEHFASIGTNEEALLPFSAKDPEGEFGNVINLQSIHHLKDIGRDSSFKYRSVAGDFYPNEILSIPIIIEGSIVSIISLVTLKEFSLETIEILNQSLSIINTSYSNIIASERTRVFADHLSRVNQKLEAQSEELQNQAEELQRTSNELQEQNIELEAQRKQVEAANTLKSEFLSNMSHELRTPLNSIMALSRVLITQTKQTLEDEEFGYLEIIERNGKRLLTLINDILDLSKIEAGKMDIKPRAVKLKPLLTTVKENLQTLADKKNLLISVRTTSKVSEIETDELRLHQILTNILSNAIKFTEKGEIKIRTKNDDKSVFISVEDSGIGISEKDIETIFDEFRQVDGSSTRAFEGTGLGLAIARKLTAALNGKLTVKSTVGKGSLFTLEIPIKWKGDFTIDKSIKLKEIDGRLLATQSKLKGENDHEPSKYKILMVEDHEEAIIQVKNVLIKEGYEVDVAPGGKEALDYMSKTIPDGIILDLMMPDIDGFEVLNSIRNKDKTRGIPVLVLTAKDLSPSDIKKLKSNNVQQLVQKGDINILGLVSKVRNMFIKKTNISSTIEIPKKERAHKDAGILIIEDNPDNLVTLRAILDNSYTIWDAENGADGLKLAKENKPDLILMDVSIPVMSGEELIRILKKDVNTQMIPIIAVTAQAMKGDKDRILSLGCDGYVPKPIDADVLLNEIERFI